MRYISGGTFQMGSDNTNFGNTPAEQPVHSVTLSPFYIDTTEITQADYQALMIWNPSMYAGDSLRPVEEVTWFDAVLYCNARSKRDGFDTVYSYTLVSGTPGNGCDGLNGLAVNYSANGYRLPTEAEWEYACRGGTTTDYYWGRSYPLTSAADTAAMDSNAVWWLPLGTKTVRVASRLPNPFGLYDMSGNVWEWCNNWYESYTSGSQTDPTGPGVGSIRVLRGGSWLYGEPSYLCSAYRFDSGSGERSGYYGFRCVRR
jgi:formylglycine-generating enzyme required for sulfatase activity